MTEGSGTERPENEMGPIAAEAACRRAGLGKIDADTRARREQRPFESAELYRHRIRAMDIGHLGRLFGAGEEKRGNIVGLAVCMSFTLLFVSLFFDIENETRTSLVSIITLALGYLFGRQH